MFITSYVTRQRVWSRQTFGQGQLTDVLCAYITMELSEIQADPDDVREWIDVIILALDGFWRHGGKPEELAEMLEAKQRVNFERAWPAMQPEDQATEHLR